MINRLVKRIALFAVGCLIALHGPSALSAPDQTEVFYLPLLRGAERDYSYARWIANYGTEDRDSVADIVERPGGGYFAVGGIAADLDYPYTGWVFALEQDGSLAWQEAHQIAGNLLDVAVTPDGGLLASGFSWGYGGVALVHYHPDLTLDWQRFYADEDLDYLGMALAEDGAIWLAGYAGALAQVWKLKPDGTPAWQNSYGGTNSHLNAIEITGDGAVVAGETSAEGAGNWDGWVMKLRDDGAVDWAKTYGTIEPEFLMSIAATSDGGYIVAGSADSLGRDGWVMKLTPDGAVTWSLLLGGDDQDELNWVGETSDGGFLVTGYSESFGASVAAGWAVKLNATGAIVWQNVYAGYVGAFIEVDEGGFVASGGSYDGDSKEGRVLRLDDRGSLSGCTLIRDAYGTTSAYPLIAGVSAASPKADPVAHGGTWYVKSATASRTIVCSASPTTLGCSEY